MNDQPTAVTPITRAEREDLQRLIRQREKVLKSAATQRSADLVADFVNQLNAEFSFDDDATWAEAKREAEAEVAKAQRKIAARCRELGIPDRFAPGLSINWHPRGHENTVEHRRRELRDIAKTKIEAIERKAITEIELSCLEAQTELAVAGLSSDTARGFVERLPGIDTLMPRLAFAEVAGEAEPPIAEQLVTPNALRQRRYRERQAALHNGHTLLPKTNGDNGDDAEAAAP
jgi:hypothetical protein